VECDTLFESSQGELQVFFKPHPNQRSEQKVMTSQVSGVQIGTISELLLGSLGTKNHLDVGAMKRRKEYHTGEGGGFPRVWAMVSLVSPESHVAYFNTKSVPKSELTNLLVGLTQVRVSN